jgi:hypothetical protein
MSWSFYFKGHVKAARYKLHHYNPPLTIAGEKAVFESAKQTLLLQLAPMGRHQFVSIEASGSGYIDGGYYHGNVSVKVEELFLESNEVSLGINHAATHPDYPGELTAEEVPGVSADPA